VRSQTPQRDTSSAKSKRSCGPASDSATSLQSRSARWIVVSLMSLSSFSLVDFSAPLPASSAAHPRSKQLTNDGLQKPESGHRWQPHLFHGEFRQPSIRRASLHRRRPGRIHRSSRFHSGCFSDSQSCWLCLLDPLRVRFFPCRSPPGLPAASVTSSVLTLPGSQGRLLFAKDNDLYLASTMGTAQRKLVTARSAPAICNFPPMELASASTSSTASAAPRPFGGQC